MERLIGEQLGNYLILDELGRGGMARVFRARQINLDRECALKLLRPELAEDESFIDRFMREARAVARLDHPNIVPVYDTGRIGPYHYLAMKFLDGQTLARILQDDRLDLRSAAAFVGQAASALEYAHQQGVVHRDIKPGNIIVDDRGWLTITDFGLARLSQEIRMTMTGTLLGTPAYMAPEQVSGDTVTPQTDIYQLGIVTYEMLTGTTPFRDRPQHAMLLAHLHEEPAPVYELNDQLTPGIDSVVQRSLAKSPSDRYQSVSEFSEDLIRAVFAVLPVDEQGGRIGPYEVSRLPETISWSASDITPIRIPTEQLNAGNLEAAGDDALAGAETVSEPSSDQIRRAEMTTSRSILDAEQMGAVGVAGTPGQGIPADTPPAASDASGGGGSKRVLIAGGALVAIIAVMSLASFQFGFIGGTESGNDPTPTATSTSVEAAAPDETATSTPTATIPAVVPAEPTATIEPASTATLEPMPTPTATLRPTITPMPTRTPIVIHTPTPAPNADPPTEAPQPDTGPVEGQVLMETDLSNWATGTLDNGELFLSNGTYHMVEYFGGGGWVVAFWNNAQPFTDFSVSVDLRWLAGEGSTDACVMARLDSIGQSYTYLLCIDGSGGVSAFYSRFNENGEITSDVLLPYGEFSAASPENWTTLKIIVRGEELWFYANGTLAGTVQHTGPRAAMSDCFSTTTEPRRQSTSSATW
ncbi:hypothetical protein BH23CHL2_BH23CHL2_27240 [soil metagenome]